MAASLTFDTAFDAPSKACVAISPRVRRIVAANPGPMTFTGTCTYIVGHGHVAVIDPGPDLPEHRDAILGALRSETIVAILVTHTHPDHSAGAARLRAATGAPVIGCNRPPRIARSEDGLAPRSEDGLAPRLESFGDPSYEPDHVMADAEIFEGPGWTLEAIATPGHTANHLAFALREEAAIFSGDHVMAWSTTFVGPPDGRMGDYMASLEKMRARGGDVIYWPGHGGPVREPQRFVRGLIGHRRQREAMIVQRLAAGDHAISEIVANVYPGLAANLRAAASLNVLAHLLDLVEQGRAHMEGAGGLGATFLPR